MCYIGMIANKAHAGTYRTKSIQKRHKLTLCDKQIKYKKANKYTD